MKYILIGMPGSGKSTIAKLLSEKKHLELCDTDHFLEKKYKLKIHDFFDVYGEDKFREFEHNAIREILDKNNIIVATGGGLPCFYNNMTLMNDAGMTIYLKADPQTLYTRIIQSNIERPLIESRTKNEIFDYLERTLISREVFYRKAQLIVDANRTIEEILRSEPFKVDL
jgi:shikimate kinase